MTVVLAILAVLLLTWWFFPGVTFTLVSFLLHPVAFVKDYWTYRRLKRMGYL